MLIPFIILAVLFVILAALTIGICNSLVAENNLLKKKIEEESSYGFSKYELMHRISVLEIELENARLFEIEI